MSSRLARLARVGAAVAATAVAGGAAGRREDYAWYDALEAPAIRPPDATFGIVWTALYADLVLSCGHALDRLDRAGRHDEAAAYRAALAANLVVNGAWSWVFFRFHRITPAVGVAALLTASSADLVRRTAAVSPAAGAALAPYPLWCGFATVLTESFRRRNR